MSELTLTQGQQNAYEAFSEFIMDPNPGVFVIKGYSGTGKSTLVEYLMDQMPKLIKTAQLIMPDDYQEREVMLTATTNQAAETFAMITGGDASTIQSALGLRVHKDYKTGDTKLVPRRGTDKLYDTLLFIDEASYIDHNLFKLIFDRTENCKIVFIGDPAQLLMFKCRTAPVFEAGFPTAELTEVVRQAEGNPIIDLSTKFRHTVNTGEFFSFMPDGNQIQALDRDTFEDKIIEEFDDPNWHHYRSKVLAWTNKAVINYNHAIRNQVKGNPQLNIGDYAVCNHYVQTSSFRLRTDQLVHITGMSEPLVQLDVPGRNIELDKQHTVFVPDSWNEAKNRVKQARADSDWTVVQIIEDQWADLRAAYSCTINKSQGSTYDRVFIDLDDIKRCNNGNQIARMLYVAVSRARETVYLTGDLV